MKRLTRPKAQQELTEAFTRYKENKNKWGKVPSSSIKRVIRQQLEDMQQQFCAYCEQDISNKDNRHIEHFYPRGRFEDKTFDWDNLFGCCKNNEHCGEYKDRRGGAGDYQPEDLIKPDEFYPSEFLQFLSNGDVVCQPNLNADDKNRAQETIRVFNLNQSELRFDRQKAIELVEEQIKAIAECASFLSGEQITQELARIKQQVENKPYQTAVLDVCFSS